MHAAPAPDPTARCTRCGKPDAVRMGDCLLCPECIQIRGSCCLEFGADDLWEASEPATLPWQLVTRGPRSHFFGYYDKPPWSGDGTRMLCVEAEETRRLPGPDEAARIQVIDPASGIAETVAETLAWNWQQGCMLQWHPADADRAILYNDRVDGRHVGVVHDLATGTRRHLPRSLYNVSPDGRRAVSVSHARLARGRPLVGYAGGADRSTEIPAPDDDGLWMIDLATGSCRLVLSLAELAAFDPPPSMAGRPLRIEHPTFAPDSRRLFLLLRWPRPGSGRPFHDRLFTVNADGSDLHLLCGDDLVSHFDWRDPDHLLAWARPAGGEDGFWLFRDRTSEVEPVAPGILTRDGHCSYSPDRRFILTDTYPDAQRCQNLWIYDTRRQAARHLGAFSYPAGLRGLGAVRCDLHPRWDRTGGRICFDCPGEADRQLAVMDVSAITRA